MIRSRSGDRRVVEDIRPSRDGCCESASRFVHSRLFSAHRSGWVATGTLLAGPSCADLQRERGDAGWWARWPTTLNIRSVSTQLIALLFALASHCFIAVCSRWRVAALCRSAYGEKASG